MPPPWWVKLPSKVYPSRISAARSPPALVAGGRVPEPENCSPVISPEAAALDSPGMAKAMSKLMLSAVAGMSIGRGAPWPKVLSEFSPCIANDSFTASGGISSPGASNEVSATSTELAA